MSHLFWELTIAYSVCYVLSVIGVGIGFEGDRGPIGVAIAGGAVIYMLGALMGLAVP